MVIFSIESIAAGEMGRTDYLGTKLNGTKWQCLPVNNFIGQSCTNGASIS